MKIQKQKQKTISRLKHGLLWVLAVFFSIMAIGTFPSISTILFIIAAIICAPVRVIDNIISTLLGKRKIFKVILVVGSFFVGIIIAPVNRETNQIDEIVNTETDKDLDLSLVAINSFDEAKTVQLEKTYDDKLIEADDSIAEVNDAAIEDKDKQGENDKFSTVAFDFSLIPPFETKDIIVVNDNTPFFSEEEISTESFESYSALDGLGRCGICVACIERDMMPKEKRGEIGNIKPSGWHTVKYPEVISDLYLYNRCHLIGYQLTGENDNVCNLITGTRQMNVNMIPYENEIADYIETTGNHVMYRVTPYFQDDNLVSSGVLMEAKSVEDDRLQFCVFLYNVQNYIAIDYANGDSQLTEEASALLAVNLSEQTYSSQSKNTTDSAVSENKQQSEVPKATTTYVVNTNTKKFHKASCSSVKDIKPSNRWDAECSRDEIIDQGYVPCKRCNP